MAKITHTEGRNMIRYAAIAISLFAWMGFAEAASCPKARLEYRVWLKQGAEYVDVQNPHVEGTELVYTQYGGEVRQSAENLIRIEPLTPETADMIRQAHLWNINKFLITLRGDQTNVVQAYHDRSKPGGDAKFDEALETGWNHLNEAEAYVKACQ
jgi:hypothetical protein